MGNEAEQVETKPPSSTSTSSGDSGLAGWIKNLGAIATILVTVGGLFVSFQELKEKSYADKATAALQLQDEQVKLQIAQQQAAQHSADVLAETNKHKADLAHEDQVADRQAAKARIDSLTVTIDHMFSGTASTEGDLAVLFNHVDSSLEDREIVANAVLAKLESPRSSSEVDLCVRLIERMGFSKIEILVQANRDARRRYGTALLSIFQSVWTAHSMSLEGTPEPDRDQRMNLSKSEALRGTGLTGYAVAYLNKSAMSSVVGFGGAQEKETAAQFKTRDLAEAVIVRTSTSILEMLRNAGKRSGPVDVSATYLQIKDLPTSSYPPLRASDAFFSGNEQNLHAMAVLLKPGSAVTLSEPCSFSDCKLVSIK